MKNWKTAYPEWVLRLLALILAVLTILLCNTLPCCSSGKDEKPSEGDIEEAIGWVQNLNKGTGTEVVKTEKIFDPDSSYQYELIVYYYSPMYSPTVPNTLEISSFNAEIFDINSEGHFRPAIGVFQDGVTGGRPKYTSLEDLDKELALAEEAVAEYMREWKLEYGWPDIASPEDITEEEDIPPTNYKDESPTAETLTHELTHHQPPGGIRDIGDVPGPANWPQAATGILLPGFLGLFIALLSSFFKGGLSGLAPTGTMPIGPAAPPEAPPPTAPLLDDLTMDAMRWITNQRKYSLYRTNEEYRELIERMEKECFGSDGRVDWEHYCDFRFGPIDEIKKAYNVREDQLLLHTKEFAKAAGQSVVDTVVTGFWGAVDFSKGLAAMPGLIAGGYGELWGLFQEMERERFDVIDHWSPDYWDRSRSGLLDDLMNPEVIKQTGKNLYKTVGKELLPVEEVKCFLEGDATPEEWLWAIPSAIIKITNFIMMSPKIATTPVPGISQDLTLIKSARPVNRAVEAAKPSVSAEVQAEYDAYRAGAAERASGVTETVEQTGMLTKEQVLDPMADPATMRLLKDAPVQTQSKFFYTQAKEVYSPVYRDVIGYMEGKNPGVEFRMKSVRTPGQKSLINTDNDAILQRKVTTADGKTYWEEVPVDEWQGKYNETFSRETGFSLEKAKARFPEKNWDGMSPQEQQKAWTEKFGQETMDVKQPEAAHAFSNQPTAMDPNWKPGAKSPVSEGRMVDADGLGTMEQYKTIKGWREGTVQSQTEAMEQGAKAGKLAKQLTPQAQARTGYQYRYPKTFEQGLEILNMRELAPAVRDTALKYLGFRGGYEGFMNKLSSWMGGLK